jgi:hypothetical protein
VSASGRTLAPGPLFRFVPERTTSFALRPELVHPGGSGPDQFGMILALPGGVLSFENMQLLLPANFLARCFYEKGTAPSRTYQGIDFSD